MGGDRGPDEIVAGAAAAASENVQPIVVGRAGLDTQGLEFLHAPDVITMEDKPTEAVRAKPASSLVVACKAVAEGKADAVVSPGNTGAMLAACLRELRRLPEVRRPAIAVTIPARRGPSVLIDAGANADARPEDLVQSAHMGTVFAQEILGVRNPEVRLLSIGEEAEKGNLFAIEAHELLAAAPQLNFAGNTEGRDLLLGAADVVVTDGFTGNVTLKILEGTITSLLDSFREEITATSARQARRPADPARRAPPPRPARPRHVRRRLPPRPPRSRCHRARKLLPPRDRERRPPRRPRRRARRRRQAGAASEFHRVKVRPLYDPDPQREVKWQRRARKSTSE